MMGRIALIARRPADSARYEKARGLHGFCVAHRGVQAAAIVLNLAAGLVGLAVATQRGVAHSPPNSVFRGALTSSIELATLYSSMAGLSLRMAKRHNGAWI